MRCSTSVVALLAAVGSVNAFSSSTTAAATSTTQVRRTIKRLTNDNFDASLQAVEPFLTQHAGRTFYTKSLNRLFYKAAAIGCTVPADFAKQAACTAARRAKQDAFIQSKEEERLAAQAEAAAADAAESDATEEAAVDEPELVEA